MVKNRKPMIVFAKEFEFDSIRGEAYPLLNAIIADIAREGIILSEKIEIRCRLILTELLTNALKHSTARQTILDIIIDEEKIEISKSDKGRNFYLPQWKEREALKWPLKGYDGNKIVIYEDQMCCLYGFIENEHKVLFSAKDSELQIPPRPKDILEHFGLMILTKSSDSFIYRYDPATESNIFQSRVFLDSKKDII
jgi:hypothetical protein